MNTDRSAATESLRGFTVLVVEDDYLIAKEIVATLRDHGADVIGPVADVNGSRKLVTQLTPDCALLDVNLRGQFVFELAEELMQRGVPPIFATGYDCSFLPRQFQAAPCLMKPLDMRLLVRSIRAQTVGRRLS